MEIYAFQLAPFEISLDATLFSHVVAMEQRKGDACGAIYIQKGFYSKLVVESGAFSTCSPHLHIVINETGH